jgi:hypothetical protein
MAQFTAHTQLGFAGLTFPHEQIMKPFHSMILRVAVTILGFALLVSTAGASGTTLSARDLAATLAARQDGTGLCASAFGDKTAWRHDEDISSASNQGAPHEDS